MKCHVIVLEYNGPALLKKCLPSIAAAVNKSANEVQLTVLDNGSDVQSIEMTRQYAPDALYVKAKQNRIFCSYNEYAKELKEPYLLFLNNDIVVDEDFIDPLIKALDDDPKVFFASPMSKDEESKEPNGGIAKLKFKWGLPWCSGVFEGHKHKLQYPSLSIETGFGLFRRDMFLALGGFDDLYLPGTVEDLDLCYRAYRQGYEGHYCPNSVVYHIGQASFKREFGASGLRSLNRRNLYLFVWKNIRSPRLIFKHLCCLPLQIIKYILTGDWDFLKGLGSAIKRLQEALKRRKMTFQEKSIIPDDQIFNLSYDQRPRGNK